MSDKPAGWASLSRAKQKILGKHLAESQQLWALQNEQRNWSGVRTLKPNSDRLLRIAERLEAGATVDECEQVLRYLGSQARKNKEQREWFNGTTNWRTDNFDRNVGRCSGAVSTGRAGDFGGAA